MKKTPRLAVQRTLRGGLAVAGSATLAVAIVFGAVPWPTAAVVFIVVAAGVWSAIDGALYLKERTRADMYRHASVRRRMVLACTALGAGFVSAVWLVGRVDLTNMVSAGALAFVTFAAGLLTLKLHQRRDPSEVDWRARLRGRAAGLGFLLRPKRNVLVIGTSLDARMLAGAIAYAVPSMHVVGALRFHGEDETRPVAGAPVFGSVDDLDDVVAQLKIHGRPVHALLAPNLSDRSLPADLTAKLAGFAAGANTTVLRDLSEVKAFARSGLEPAGGSPDGGWSVRRGIRRRLLRVYRTWASARSGALKRGFDILVSAGVLLAAAPLFGLAALGVRLTLGSPIFFWQERTGRFGRPFRVFKLRTMRAADRKSGERSSDAARVTPFGALLRRLRIDEAPQLWSVLRGDMSIVGPRPLLPEDMPRLAEARLLIRPGITGWAQVNGGHVLTPEEKVALDVWYARRASLAFDLAIILASIRVVLTGDIRKEREIAAAVAEFKAFEAALDAALASGDMDLDLAQTAPETPMPPRPAPRRRLLPRALFTRGRPTASPPPREAATANAQLALPAPGDRTLAQSAR